MTMHRDDVLKNIISTVNFISLLQYEKTLLICIMMTVFSHFSTKVHIIAVMWIIIQAFAH